MRVRVVRDQAGADSGLRLAQVPTRPLRKAAWAMSVSGTGLPVAIASRRVVTTNPVLHEEVPMSGSEKSKAHAEQAKGTFRQ
ncbi:hypothetical protein ACIF8W_37210 [Streptomyces sp. NPDC085639]|uniref:hypothetical protein n=1 Tax=Streptomyces sp. NPDC085639 TaxID=3365734 RepID=UPI0037D09688